MNIIYTITLKMKNLSIIENRATYLFYILLDLLFNTINI